jgi:hypothetical protein
LATPTRQRTQSLSFERCSIRCLVPELRSHSRRGRSNSERIGAGLLCFVPLVPSMTDGHKLTRIQELFGDERNADPFRLAILGFAKIEETLNRALADAFGGELPDELRRTHFNVRVSLAVALGLMPEAFRPPLGKLKQIRDEFAHGKRDDLTPSRGREIYASTRALVPDIETEVPSLKNEEQPEIHLVNLLFIVETGLLASFEEARERQKQRDHAMREWWQRRALTREQISELLTSEATNAPDLEEG